jgi:hypothetical protein
MEMQGLAQYRAGGISEAMFTHGLTNTISIKSSHFKGVLLWT